MSTTVPLRYHQPEPVGRAVIAGLRAASEGVDVPLDLADPPLQVLMLLGQLVEFGLDLVEGIHRLPQVALQLVDLSGGTVVHEVDLSGLVGQFHLGTVRR